MHQVPPTFWVDGAAIRKRRMQKGMSTSDLARVTGASVSYINKIELGSRDQMGPQLYVALRTALQATDDDLLTHEDPHERK
ncbi:helix-turn-helix domain-containing protein [Streptomyces abikoensis]|uniref:Helix-turn-helix domain-containing protein n=1 Tax=Streptomyces abikoensis TaxID=97398 RepID=A0ABW7TA11_9ACTN